MHSVRRFIVDGIIFLTIIGMMVFLYQTYSEPVISYFFNQPRVAMSVRDVTVLVSIADSPEERKIGLAGVDSLPDKEGKLFIFDKESYPGFWMKDTLIPLDIIWINNERRIVHIEQNVQPDSYPLTYNTPEPARFVLEVNAFFASTFKLSVGDTVTIPLGQLPKDLRAQ